jgi:hypothetical protein
MSTDKLLQKIQSQMRALSHSMETFHHDHVQPSADDCDKLKTELHDLLEILAVYRHQKQDSELAPSFELHARVSEMEKGIENISNATGHPRKTEDIENKKPESIPVIEDPKTISKPKQPFLIGINDKFRFINELFTQNSSEYHAAVEQLSTLNNWHDSQAYLKSLTNVYGWKDDNEVVKYFYGLVRKRFD